MNYALIYSKLIAKAKYRVCINGYVERHHILPKALGGTNDSSNLVALTAREHFIAHLLLARLHGGSMWHAVAIMKKDGRGTSRSFEIARKKLSELMMGNTKTLGFKHSKETKEKMSLSRKGKNGLPHSNETKELLSRLNAGKSLSEETKTKLSLAQKGIKKPDGFGSKISAALIGKTRPQSVKDKISKHYAALREAKKTIELLQKKPLPIKEFLS